MPEDTRTRNEPTAKNLKPQKLSTRITNVDISDFTFLMLC